MWHGKYNVVSRRSRSLKETYDQLISLLDQLGPSKCTELLTTVFPPCFYLADNIEDLMAAIWHIHYQNF